MYFRKHLNKRKQYNIHIEVYAMPFKEKDFILIDYTATVKETNTVVDTTNSEKAKESNIYDENKTYEPTLVIIGEGRVVKGLEEALQEMNEGEQKVIELPPSKAYGERDPNRLRRIPIREFKKGDVEPVPGKVVEINGVPALIRDVTGGRVLVDFNHPLAGKTIVYEVKVIKYLQNDDEKVKALLKRRLRPKNIDDYNIKISKEEGFVQIKIPETEMINPDIQLAKRALAREIFNYIEGIKKVEFIEEIIAPEKPKEETAEEKEKPSEEKPKEEAKQ
ncbi:peptidylprolyl isomerase [Fervidicoccus fontis]|nr:FKBP-type peptidyl-prolyl cis-trans isomerase [Fervidicoccus fontis]